VSDRRAQDSAHQVDEGEPVAALRRARVINQRAERTLFSQDDREHRQTAELDDALMSDDLISVGAQPAAHPFSPGPASHVLERFASCTGCAPFLGCIRSRVALQCPQGPLDVCRDTFAFLVDRHAVRG
jgi:hypothetical protein